MAILVGSDVPGLLSALEQALGGSQQLTIVRDAESITALISNPAFRLDALIASDTITPPPGKDAATALWEIASYMSRYREPLVPVVLTLARETPALIQDALRAEVRKTGGDLQLMTSRARTPEHPEARQVVAWIVAQLKLEPHRRQYQIVSASSAGGAGKTSTVMHLCLQLARLGLRVLVVDLDISQGALATFFRVDPTAYETFTTLPDEYPDLVTTYPLALVERRIVHHASGLDLLFAGQGVRDQLDMSTPCLEGLIDTLGLFDYDVVCCDLAGDWKTRPVIVSLLTRRTTTPIIVCPPGRKERMGAHAALDVLGKIRRDDGSPALDAAMLVFIEGERGHVMDIRTVRQEVLRQYPTVTDLGTVPRDPALLSMAAERHEFCSIFDLAPRRPYCHAMRGVARRWLEAVDIPPTWLTRIDPYEQTARPARWRRWFTWTSTPPTPPLPQPDAAPRTEVQP